MKTKTLILALAVISFFFTVCSCSDKNKTQTPADDKFGKLEVAIPESLKDKPEVVAYIKETANITDEYALLIDKVVEDAGEYKGIKEEDLSTTDKIKLTQIAAEVGFKSIELMGKWAEFTEKRVSLEENMSEDEIKSFDAVYKRFEERMEQVKAKHAEFFDNKKEENNE